MKDRKRWRARSFVTFGLVMVSGLLVSGAQQEFLTPLPARTASVSDCTYLQNPDEFRIDTKVRFPIRTALNARMAGIFGKADAATTLDPGTIVRKNFIDNSIFDRMAAAGIQSAPLTSDVEYLRRVTLDLTGRIPAPADVASFTADTNPSKRDLLVDSLIGTPEFIDKWTMFFGDLYKNTSQSINVTRYIQGRDAFYLYIKDAVTQNKPYDQMARELISATGDSFAVGNANWPVGGTISMGPVQDTYDGQTVAMSEMFMGINSTDCLLCHDGAHHLDQVNLWGSKELRVNMWGLSAYFARTQMQRQTVSSSPAAAKYVVSDKATGEYQLNTTTGNRVARQPVNGSSFIQPNNPFVVNVGPIPLGSGIAPGESRRQAIARELTGNIQFSRAIVNYIWEKIMVEAFVTPSNSFDLARLDPSQPPAAGWTLQATNPALLNSLAAWFQSNKYDVRALMSLITKSNAYQLSADYPGTWNDSYVPYYARKYVRRLDAEEIHDAIEKATGVFNTYTFDYLPSVQWAMQLPEPREPVKNSAVVAYLNSFGRGDRDQNPRRSDGSVLQTLNLMNNTFVMTRMHQNNAGSRVASILSQTTDPTTIINQLYLYTLSRNPTAAEIAMFLPTFTSQQQTAKVAAESLQWVLLNKMDFLFNY